jgi:hypothetical protein
MTNNLVPFFKGKIFTSYSHAGFLLSGNDEDKFAARPVRLWNGFACEIMTWCAWTGQLAAMPCFAVVHPGRLSDDYFARRS